MLKAEETVEDLLDWSEIESRSELYECAEVQGNSRGRRIKRGGGN